MIINRKDIEQALTFSQFRAWLLAQPLASVVGFTTKIVGSEEYPADETVIARYLKACFPGETIWSQPRILGYWSDGHHYTFTLESRKYFWANWLLEALDAIATAPGLQRLTQEQVLTVFSAFSADGELLQPQVGMRVYTITSIDRFPNFLLAGVGLTGTVTSIEGHLIVIKMDEYIPGCEEWDNEIVLTNDEFGDYGHGVWIETLAQLFYYYFAPLPPN